MRGQKKLISHHRRVFLACGARYFLMRSLMWKGANLPSLVDWLGTKGGWHGVALFRRLASSFLLVALIPGRILPLVTLLRLLVAAPGSPGGISCVVVWLRGLCSGTKFRHFTDRKRQKWLINLNSLFPIKILLEKRLISHFFCDLFIVVLVYKTNFSTIFLIDKIWILYVCFEEMADKLFEIKGTEPRILFIFALIFC